MKEVGPNMRLPDLGNLRDKVASMRSETMGDNVEFVGKQEAFDHLE